MNKKSDFHMFYVRAINISWLEFFMDQMFKKRNKLEKGMAWIWVFSKVQKDWKRFNRILNIFKYTYIFQLSDIESITSCERPLYSIDSFQYISWFFSSQCTFFHVSLRFFSLHLFPFIFHSTFSFLFSLVQDFFSSTVILPIFLFSFFFVFLLLKPYSTSLQ